MFFDPFQLPSPSAPAAHYTTSASHSHGNKDD
jgi:hypothetical protein